MKTIESALAEFLSRTPPELPMTEIQTVQVKFAFCEAVVFTMQEVAYSRDVRDTILRLVCEADTICMKLAESGKEKS